YQLVPAASPAQARNAFAAQAKDLPRLGPGGYFHLDLALERRDLDLGAQSSLGKADGNLTDDVSPLPGEQRVLTHVNHDVQTASPPPSLPEASFPRDLETRAGIPPGRNFHLPRSRRPYHPLPATGGAGISDARPLPAALTTGAGDGEEPLLVAHLTAAATGRT